MAGDNDYLKWRAAVDQQLNGIYCIAIKDAGFDEEYLLYHWRLNETASDFVEWFGIKYDLESRHALGV